MPYGLIGPLEIQFIIGIVLSVLIGFAIGAERESRGKDAGISTHVLVILGAMLFTVLSSVVDPTSTSRIAAQIVTGIGFLGAGLILKEGASVKNLTTAASLWVAGAIGMSIGFGFYAIAVLAGIVSMLIPRIPHLQKKNAEQ
ncbi:MAG: MgtC/SapB family protein [Patescibacteria group bacterium]